MKQSSLLVLILSILCLAIPAYAQSDVSMDTGSQQDQKPKKQDTSVILDMLPGPDHSVGLRNIFKHYALTITSIEIDHPDPQDPITVKILFDLPVKHKCEASLSDLAVYLNRTAIWQADPAETLMPMNMWARALSRGQQDLFLPQDCPS